MKFIVFTCATIILFSASGFLASGEVGDIKVYNLICSIEGFYPLPALTESASINREIQTRPMTEKDVEENSGYDSAIVGKPYNKGGNITFNDFTISYKIIGSPSIAIYLNYYKISAFTDDCSEESTRLSLTTPFANNGYRTITCSLKLKEICNN